MPRFVRDLPRFSRGERAAIDVLYRLRIRSLQAVDRGVARLVHTLRSSGQLDNTYIVFTSDNGFHLGQHRLPAGKQTAYDTDIHVPLLIRGPGITAGSHVTQLTGNVDLAPTFEAMAAVPAPSFTDGRSLLDLADGTARAGRPLAQRLPRRTPQRTLRPRSTSHGGRARSRWSRRTPTRAEPDRHDPGRARTDICREPRDEGVLARHEPIPNYDAVRTLRYLYVAYANGDRELYDTSTDPGEIHNLAGTMPALQHALAAAGREPPRMPGPRVPHRGGAAGPIGRPVRTLLRCPASGEPEPPSSSGLGRRPFKAVTGIRTPLGARDRLRSALVL